MEGSHFAVLAEGFELFQWKGGLSVSKVVIFCDGSDSTADGLTFVCSSSSIPSFTSMRLPKRGKPEGPGGSLGALPSLSLRLPRGLKYSAKKVKRRRIAKKKAPV